MTICLSRRNLLLQRKTNWTRLFWLHINRDFNVLSWQHENAPIEARQAWSSEESFSKELRFHFCKNHQKLFFEKRWKLSFNGCEKCAESERLDFSDWLKMSETIRWMLPISKATQKCLAVFLKCHNPQKNFSHRAELETWKMASKEHDLLPPLTEIQAVKYFNTLKVFSTWEKGREFLGLDGVKMLTDFLEKLSGSKTYISIFFLDAPFC